MPALPITGSASNISNRNINSHAVAVPSIGIIVSAIRANARPRGRRIRCTKADGLRPACSLDTISGQVAMTARRMRCDRIPPVSRKFFL